MMCRSNLLVGSIGFHHGKMPFRRKLPDRKAMEVLLKETREEYRGDD